MSALADPIREGLPRWKVHGGEHAPLPPSITVDIAIIGSGAGGGTSAELLTQAGFKVLVIEEGPLRSSSDFKQLETDAYPQLYQESAGRKTADKAINILQGRCVGGSTTVNWTSSFRTPPDTLRFWRERLGLTDFSVEAMAPWFERAEARLSIGPWQVDPNPNNGALARGLVKLGLGAPRILRNVKGCWNLGSCGMGCPTNAKQSMLVTTLPAALDAGAAMYVQTRVQSLVHDGRQVQALDCVPVALNGDTQGPPVRVVARHIVLAGGAINSPALLLRSKAPDPFGLLGHRTFLHPVVVSKAHFSERIEGWAGAPQSIYSDHFQDTSPIDGPLGYKLEAPPLHPLIMASTLAGFGQSAIDDLRQLPHQQVLLALMRDGFHPHSVGGRVQLKSDGSPQLAYPLTGILFEAAQRALLSMAEIQFAAGAQHVQPLHEQATPYRTWAQAKAAIAELPMQPYLLRVVSAHVMGGCAMSVDPSRGVCRSNGQHWQLQNLSIHDGSLFPTSIGANPQLSIYGLVARLTAGLIQRLHGQAAPGITQSAQASSGILHG
jgi:choline dehydrogenase-like flavoprotein